MTASVRYQLVTNTTGAALTAAGVSLNGGDDKAYRVIKRTFAAADIGTGAGQTREAAGCIIGVLPANTNVLALKCCAFKVTGGAARAMDNLTLSVGAQIASLSYSIDANNNIRVVDAGNNATVQLAANDYVLAELIIGPN